MSTRQPWLSFVNISRSALSFLHQHNLPPPTLSIIISNSFVTNSAQLTVLFVIFIFLYLSFPPKDNLLLFGKLLLHLLQIHVSIHHCNTRE